MAISCRTCGNQNPDGATACQYCGAQLGATPAPTGEAVASSAEQPTQVVAAIPPAGESAGGIAAPNQVGPGYGQPPGYGQSYGASPPPGYGQGGYGAQGGRYGQSYGAATAPPAAPPKDPTTGLLLELLPGLFVVTLGIGWLYAGEIGLGIALLLGYWALWATVAFVGVFLAAVTLGVGLFCVVPLFILLYFAAPIASALMLQKRLKARQASVVGAQPF